jgi:hypothetical protein
MAYPAPWKKPLERDNDGSKRLNLNGMETDMLVESSR